MSATQCCSDMPDAFPGTYSVDRYTGQFLRRLGTLRRMLEPPFLSEEDRTAADAWWTDGTDKPYREMQARVPGSMLLDDTRCESMDRIREHRRHFADAYSGTVYDYLDLMDAIGRVEEMIAFLQGEGRSAASYAEPEEGMRMRVRILDAIDECDQHFEGWYRLSDVGAALHRQGKGVDHLGTECERLGFDVMKRPTGGILGSFDVYIRPGRSSGAR